MTTLEFTATYGGGYAFEVDLPEGYTKNDVESIEMRWNDVYVTFTDGTYHKQEVPDISDDIYFWKFPNEIEF